MSENQKAISQTTITLYRVGPLPSEARAIAEQSNLSPWLRDALKESGHDEALGRWFTSDRRAADWYAREHPGYQVRSVTVSATDAAKWRAADHADARRFASEPEHEYFLPRDVADAAKALSPWGHRIEQGRNAPRRVREIGEYRGIER